MRKSDVPVIVAINKLDLLQRNITCADGDTTIERSDSSYFFSHKPRDTSLVNISNIVGMGSSTAIKTKLSLKNLLSGNKAVKDSSDVLNQAPALPAVISRAVIDTPQQIPGTINVESLSYYDDMDKLINSNTEISDAQQSTQSKPKGSRLNNRYNDEDPLQPLPTEELIALWRSRIPRAGICYQLHGIAR